MNEPGRTSPALDRRTAHMAAECRVCGCCWVVSTIPPGGAPIEAVCKTMGSASCPECGAEKPGVALNEKHALAVSRLRREAALD